MSSSFVAAGEVGEASLNETNGWNDSALMNANNTTITRAWLNNTASSAPTAVAPVRNKEPTHGHVLLHYTGDMDTIQGFEGGVYVTSAELVGTMENVYVALSREGSCTCGEAPPSVGNVTALVSALAKLNTNTANQSAALGTSRSPAPPTQQPTPSLPPLPALHTFDGPDALDDFAGNVYVSVMVAYIFTIIGAFVLFASEKCVPHVMALYSAGAAMTGFGVFGSIFLTSSWLEDPPPLAGCVTFMLFSLIGVVWGLEKFLGWLGPFFYLHRELKKRMILQDLPAFLDRGQKVGSVHAFSDEDLFA